MVGAGSAGLVCAHTLARQRHDVINAAEHFVKGKRQNQLTDGHIAKIIKTYQFREEEARYSRRVGMAEIE
jgi:type I restriction-modification system DNA methylase subunit